MSMTKTFSDTVERYLRASGMSAKAFGEAAVSDPNFVRELRKGRSVGTKLIDRVIAYMHKHPSEEDAA